MSLQSRVVDTDSIYFASKYNPVYTVGSNSIISVYPVPDGTNDGFRVHYVNNEPKGDGLSDTLAAGHTTIGYFPKDKVHLVVIYAGIKSLENKLGEITIDEEDSELSRTLNTQLESLKDDYELAFKPPPSQQQNAPNIAKGRGR